MTSQRDKPAEPEFITATPTPAIGVASHLPAAASEREAVYEITIFGHSDGRICMQDDAEVWMIASQSIECERAHYAAEDFDDEEACRAAQRASDFEDVAVAWAKASEGLRRRALDAVKERDAALARERTAIEEGGARVRAALAAADDREATLRARLTSLPIWAVPPGYVSGDPSLTKPFDGQAVGAIRADDLSAALAADWSPS